MPARMTLLDMLYDFLGTLLFIGYLVLVMGLSLRVIMKRRPIGISLAWLALIYAVPVLGLSVYLLFGEIRLGRKRAERAMAMYEPYSRWIRELVSQFEQQPAPVSEKAWPMVELVESRLGMPMLRGNQVQLLTETEQIFSSIQADIQASTLSCYLEFYIWQGGGKMDRISLALMDAARRGVECRLMLDSVGSADFFRSPWPERLQEAGVRVVEVLPAGAWRIPFHRQDLRMHRKLVVIDDRIAYTGSMNMADPRFFKREAGVGQWIDIMLRLQGPIVPLIWSLFVRDWEMETGERLLDAQQHTPEFFAEEDHHLQLIPSGPFTGGDCIQQTLLHAIYQARFRLVLTTPYFVPDDPLVAALQAAAERGVQVQLILPARNDSRMVNYACNAFLEELLTAGVEVYRFRAGLLHSKSVLVDDELALVGSLNLDRRSLWLNFEASLLVDGPRLVAELSALQGRYMARSDRMQLHLWQARSRFQRLKENLFYLLSPLL